MITIETVETPSLGDRSYLANDGQVAVVVDPQRDIDRVLAVAAERGVRITQVLETHVHNDYVTGGLELARRAARRTSCPPAAVSSSTTSRVADGDMLEAGRDARAGAATPPGHTHHHVSYVLADAERRGPGGVHRRLDALRRDRTHRPGRPDPTDELTHAQYHSVRRLARELPAEAAGAPDPRVRQLLLGDPDQRRRLDRSASSAG